MNLLKHYMFTLNELMIMVYRYLKINDNLDLSVKASYNTREDYLEIEFSSDLLPEEISKLINALKFKEDFYRTKDGRYIEFNNSKRELIELLLNAII